MTTQRNEIVTVLTVDARDLEAKAAASAAAVDKIGASLGKLAGAATTVETTLDASAKVSRRQAAELENLLRSIDPVYAAHAKLAAEQKRVEAAMTALDAQYRNGARSAEVVSTATTALADRSKQLSQIQSELSRGLITASEAAARTASAMGGAKAAVDGAAQAYSALRDRMDPTAKAYEALNNEASALDVLLKAGRLTLEDHARGMSFLASEIDKVSGKTAQLAAIEAARAQQAAQHAQYTINQQFGIGSTPASASQSASVFEEAARNAEKEAQAIAALQTKAQGLKETIDPLSKVQRVFAAAVSDADVLLAKGMITYEDHARAVKLYHDALLQARQAVGAHGEAVSDLGKASKLSYENQMVLRSGVINTFQSISAGLPIGQTLLTQTTQTAPAFAEMAKNTGVSTTALVAFGVPAAAAAVAIGAIAVKMLQAQGQAREFSTMLRSAGQQAVLTAQDVKAAADRIYDAGGSREDIASVLNSAISSRKFSSAAQLEEIGTLSVDLGVKLGGTAEAGKKLVEWLTSGIPGLRDMAKETEALSLAQYEAARAALEHGNKAQAQKIIIGALQAQFTGLHRDAMGPAEKAFHDLTRAYDDFVTAAANNPVVIKVVVQGAQVLEGLAGLMKGDFNVEFPNPFGWALDQASGGNFTAKPPPTPSNNNAPQQPKPQTFTAAGTFAGRQSTTQSGMSASEAREMSDLVAANDRLLAAMQKTGAARQVAVAQAQAEIAALKAGKSAYAAEAEGIQAARMARAQMAAGIADATAQLTIQARESLKVADAYMQSAAAGQAAEAMRQAQLDSLQSGVSVEQRYQEILNERAATQAATTAAALQTYQQEVAGREAVANATMQGVEAAYAAEMAEKVRVGTLAETIALENASGEAAEKLRKVIEAKTAAILDDERAQRKLQVAQAIQQQKDQLELGQAQLRLMGASAEQRAVEIARLQALIYLRNQHIDAMSAEGQAYITNAENIARQSLETERLNAAYQELERFGDQAFSSIIDAVVKGGDATGTWKNAVKGLVTEFETLALKMAVLNPIKNAVFGSNLPTIFDFGSIGGGSAANQNGGGLLSNGNLLSLGSKFLPTGGINAAIDSWGYSALGIGTATSTVIPGIGGAAATTAATTINPATGSLAAYNSWGAAGAQGAGSGVAAGTGLSGLLGAAGAGAIGGMAAGYLGTATNSKAVGGLSGAALGAGASYLGGSLLGISAMTGPIGLGIAAAVGLITGLLGTQKATVGKTASADVTINAGGKSATYGNVLTDNDGDPAAGQALGTALSGIYSIAAMGGGKLTKDFGIGQTQKDGLYVAGSVPYKKFGDDISGLLRYTLLEQGGLKDGGANTIKALQNSKAKDWEEAAKDIGLGASIDAGNTALKEMIKTLSGVTDAAKKAADDSFKPMFDELARAQKLGIDGAYKDLATDQLKAYLDQLKNPVDFTQTEQDMAALKGQFQAARDAYAQLNPAMATYVDQIEKETKARMARNFTDSLDQQIRQVGGRDYINQISGYIQALDANARSLIAVGEPTTKAQELYNASLKSLLKTLSADQLGDVARTFGGDIATLASTISAAATAAETAAKAAETAARFEDLFSQIRQQNIQEDIGLLNEQINTAKSAQSQWQNLLTSIGNFRGSLLTGDLSPLSPKAKLDEAMSQFNAAVSAANGGDVTAAGQVQSLAQAALQAAKSYYASSEDYARIFDQVQSGLGGVESVASRQVSLQASQLSTLQASLATQQSMLDALNKTSQTDVNSVLSGLNSGNLADLVRWGQRQGSDVLMQVLQTADNKLGQAGNPYRYKANAGIMSIADHMSTQDYLDIGKTIGFSGTIDALNPWIVAYSKQDAFEAAVRQWGASHGYENGGIVGNGMWGRDSVLAQYAGGGMIALAGGEGVLTARATASIGSGAVDYINRTGMLPANDRWGGNVLPFRGGQPGGSSNADQGWKAVVSELQAMNRDQVDLGKAMVTELAQARRTNAALLEENRRLRQQLSDGEGKRQPRAAYK